MALCLALLVFIFEGLPWWPAQVGASGGAAVCSCKSAVSSLEGRGRWEWSRGGLPRVLVQVGPAAGGPLSPCQAAGLPGEVNVLSRRVPAGQACSPGGRL